MRFKFPHARVYRRKISVKSATLHSMCSRFPYKPRRRTVLNPVYDRAAETERERERLKEKPEKRKADTNGQRTDTKFRMRTAVCLLVYKPGGDDTNYKRGNRRNNAIVRAFSLTINTVGELMHGLITIIISSAMRWQREWETKVAVWRDVRTTLRCIINFLVINKNDARLLDY